MTTKKPITDWSEEACLRLIQEYESRPLLWDTSHLQFYKTAARGLEWEDIGVALGIPARECKHKMSILMSSLRREKFKMRNQMKKKGRPYISRWFALDAMSFLMKKNDSNNISDAMDDINDHSDASRTENSNATLQNLDASSSQQHAVLIDSRSSRKRKHSESSLSEPGLEAIKFELNSYTSDDQETPFEPGDDDPLPISYAEPNTTRDPINDEIQSFTNFIACKMRKMNEKTKNAVQRDILDIVFKANLK